LGKENVLYIQTLMKLGLTFLQSTIYLTLTQIGKAEVKKISNTSNVARSDVYRVISTLEQMGLVEKIVSTPTMYRAITLKEGYTLLLQNKTKECAELHDKVSDLFKNTLEIHKKFSEDDQFVLISSKKLLEKKCLTEDQKLQDSLYVIGDKAMRSWFYVNLQIFKQALERGVKFRVITHRNDYDQMLKIKQMLNDDPAFCLKYMGHIPIRTAIYDGKKAWLSVDQPHNDESKENAVVHALFSNNLQFLKVLISYFENIWTQANDLTIPEKK
jgi:sugar-specific transcriptional regulator TrmB